MQEGGEAGGGLSREQITQVYQDELKRDPNFDVEGGASYWLNSDITDPEVLRKTIRQSGEYQDLTDPENIMKDRVSGEMPEGTVIQPSQMTVGAGELVTPPAELKPVSLDTKLASEEGLTVTAPEKIPAPVVDAALTTPDVAELGLQAAQGQVSPEAVIGDIQGEVSANAIATAATQELDERATIQYQLSELTKSLETGGPLPSWAAPTARAVNGVMQSRGLGKSSVAAAAMTQALMESAIPIASQDANKYATIQLQNLNNEQQAALQNAATFAAMDTANLNARMTAAVNNAKSFLSIDMANMEAEQQARTITYNAKVQALFTDAAAANATEQFNARNQMQVDQFFAELGTQVDTANAQRTAAMRQFNVDQENSMATYVASLNDARQQFNTNMKAQIDQSNAVWRREINTFNTATQNEVNRVNAQNLLNVTTSALNSLWQRYRDEAGWAFQMTQNEVERAHQFGLLAMELENNKSLYDEEMRDNLAVALGTAAIRKVFS